MRRAAIAATVTLVAACIACGGAERSTSPSNQSGAPPATNPGGAPATAPLGETAPYGLRPDASAPAPRFTASIVDTNAIVYIRALGHVNPPSHTFPSDHIYFYLSDPSRCPCPLPAPVPVYAPGNGTVVEVQRAGAQFADDAIRVTMSSSAYWYLNHVTLDPSIQVGQQLAAGQRLGTTSGIVFAVDLGLVNANRTRTGYINSNRYPYSSIHAESPIAFYDEPLRSRLQARVLRVGSDKDGRADYDVAGRLAGGWFVAGTTDAAMGGPDVWSKTLYFLHDVERPDELRISVGGTLSLAPGVFAVQPDSIIPALPSFETVGQSNGAVSYPLYNAIVPAGNRPLVGHLLVQLLAGDTLQAEIFSGTAAPTAFTDKAVRYTR